ncbi:MAG: DUF423 domain-containing protein [Flavobacteriales bacterium]
MGSLRWGILLVLVSIILGAFGAHYFSEILEPKRFNSLKTGINYQMYMGLALIALNALEHRFKPARLSIGLTLIIIGTLMFSLSIFSLVYLGHNDISTGRAILGPITPLGGSVLIIGWIITLLSVKKSFPLESK